MTNNGVAMDIARLSVRQLVKYVQNGQLTATAIAQHYNKQIQQYESKYHCFAYYNAEQFLHSAQQFDTMYNKLSNDEKSKYTLAGIPIGVKDIINTVDQPTSYGSPIYTNNQPATDAAVIQLMKQLGSMVAGKTHTTEFAYYEPSVALNPCDSTRTPGGSSSGSAAAVSANMLPIAFGTQTVGSIIRPASFCGIVGYKPTYNTLCTNGVNDLSWSLDTVGSLAKTVDDAVYMVAALTNRTNELIGEWTHSRIPNIVLCKTHEWSEGATTELQYVWQQLENALSHNNCTIQHIELPIEFKGLSNALNTILAYEASIFHTVHYKQHKSKLSSKLQQLIETGQTIQYNDVIQAKQLIRQCNNILDTMKQQYKFDAMIVPSACGIAPLLSEQNTGLPLFNRCWTALGVPCVNVPGLHSEMEKLPVGICVVGTLHSDVITVQTAAWIERAIQNYVNK